MGLCDGLFSALRQFDGELLHHVARHNCTPEALEADRAPTRLEVVLRSGARHVLDVNYPRGSPKNPATRAELEVKFDALAAPIFPTGRLAQTKAALFALESVPTIRDFARLCGQTERDRVIDRGTQYGTPIGQEPS